MWGGVDRGLAGVKLSGSPSRYGEKNVRVRRKVNIKMSPSKSL